MNIYPGGVAENSFFSVSHYWKATIVPLLLSSTCVKDLKSLFTDYSDIYHGSIAEKN